MQAAEGSTEGSEEEVFNFPWAGEPFWQVWQTTVKSIGGQCGYLS